MFLERQKQKITSCTKPDEMLLPILQKHAPLKNKLLRANHATYISKPLRKAILQRSYLENLHFKKRTDHSLRNYKKQKAIAAYSRKKREKTFLIS